MKVEGSVLGLCLLALVSIVVNTVGTVNPTPKPSPYSMPFNRSLYPTDFIFGAGMAAYQSEGAANEDGRKPGLWDTFTDEHPEKIADASNGDVADDFYHRYKWDIKLMKKIGLDSFRFSISWSRVLPKGRVSGGVNPLGVKFYNDVIDELLANGIEPFVTLYHWDYPQILFDEYGAWLSPKAVTDFRDYVDFCFKTFGDRVKKWCTLNEPNGNSFTGFGQGTTAPGRCSNYSGTCSKGNSATESYIVAHNYLLSHATAVKLYKEKYQARQKGIIGITIVSHWFEPYDNTAASRAAASRALDFMFGWFVNPITYGDYPKIMKELVGNRLPKFTKAQSKMLKGSYDFLGVNYYTANYAQKSSSSNSVNQSWYTDALTTLTTVRNGVSIGTPTALDWLFIKPEGIYELMMYTKKKYNDPIIYITENGVAEANNNSLPIKTALKDSVRIRYHDSHLKHLLKAIKEGVRVKGYYLWSFFDDFEWDAGYTVRFGIIYVDFKNNVKRYMKYSAYWFKMFLLN